MCALTKVITGVLGWGRRRCRTWLWLYLDKKNSFSSESSDIPVDAPISGEVRRAIRKLRNGRAPGPGGIQPELLEYAEPPVVSALHALSCQVWKTGTVPAEWRAGIIVSL